MKWLFVLLALFSFTATAQQVPSLGLAMEINDQDADLRSCGISKSSVEALAVLTLRNNRIGTLSNPAGAAPYLYVNPTALYNSNLNLCAVTLAVSIRWFTSQDNVTTAVNAPVRNRNGLVDLVFCESSALFVSPQANINNRFTSELERNIKLCLGKLNY